MILIWLSMMEEFDCFKFIKFLKAFNQLENIFNMSKNKFLFRDFLVQNNLKISLTLFNLFTSNVFKEKAIKVYNNLVSQNIEFISFFSKEYPLELKGTINSPLVLFVYGNKEIIKEINKRVYIYASNFEEIKRNKKILDIYNHIISKENIIVINNINSKIKLYVENIFDEKYSLSEKIDNKAFNYIIPTNHKYKEEIVCSIVDSLVILNSKFENNILKLSSLMLDMGKLIYVLPGNIEDKNYAFSNYLIKDGANIILSKKDIDFL